MVDRYNMIGRDAGARMDVSPNGVWVRYCDLAAASAEIKRLKRELEITHNSRNELAETWKDRAIKAESERDAALALLADAYGAGTGGSVIESLLADAERDMRQRAADVCDRNDQVSGWVSRDAILALPLKHADREGKQ